MPPLSLTQSKYAFATLPIVVKSTPGISMSRPSILIGAPVAFLPFPSPQPFIAADLAPVCDVAALAAKATTATHAITSPITSTNLRTVIQAVLSAAVWGTSGGSAMQPKRCSAQGGGLHAATMAEVPFGCKLLTP